MANKLYVNNSNGRKERATKATFNDATGREIFQWLSGMVKDGLAETNPDLGTGNFDNLLGIQSGIARDGVRHQRGARHGHRRSSAVGRRRTWRSAWRRSRARDRCRQGRRAGERWLALHGEQVGAGEAGGRVAVPEVPRLAPRHMATWAVGTGYIPIRETAADELADAGLLGGEPRLQGGLRPAAQRAEQRRDRRDR